MKYLILIMALIIYAPASAFAMSEDVSWKHYFLRAQNAFEQKNYWEARRMFYASIDMAERRNEDLEFASSLDALANAYALKHRPKVAEVLHRKAIEIFVRKYGPSHIRVAQSTERFLWVSRQADGDTEPISTNARVILVSHQE